MEHKSWNRLSDEKLLAIKICDLKLVLAESKIQPLIDRLYSELQLKHLIFRPPCFIADEWFVPVGIPAIGIPFYLLHPRLRRLEQKLILEVEGGTKTEFMKLMRHEAGHAYSYAYKLYKRPRWRKLFGSVHRQYPEPDQYKRRPYSRSYVRHLDDWYAQSHPDEDFAETFAVWLTPGLNWRKKYRGWKALAKLEYVDTLMNSLADKKPALMPKFHAMEHAGINQLLRTHYRKKQKAYETAYPNFYDNDLKILFTDDPDLRSNQKASKYIRASRTMILRSISQWTKEKKIHNRSINKGSIVYFFSLVH